MHIKSLLFKTIPAVLRFVFYRFLHAVAVEVVGEVGVKDLANVEAFLGNRGVVREPHCRGSHVTI